MISINFIAQNPSVYYNFHVGLACLDLPLNHAISGIYPTLECWPTLIIYYHLLETLILGPSCFCFFLTFLDVCIIGESDDV